MARLTGLAALAAVVLLGSGCVGPRGALVARGLRDARSTADELAQAVRSRRVAVLVGVSAYQDPAFPALRFPGDDARALGEILRSPTGGGFDQVLVLATPPETTRARVLQQLTWVTDGLDRQDVLVVYFSGHGTVSPPAAGTPRLYLLGGDARPSDLAGTAIDVSELRAWFARLAPQRKALIVDACFNGRGKSSIDPDLRPQVEEILEATRPPDLSTLGSGEAHLYATTVGRAAFEDEQLGHGVYTHFLLQALS